MEADDSVERVEDDGDAHAARLLTSVRRLAGGDAVVLGLLARVPASDECVRAAISFDGATVCEAEDARPLSARVRAPRDGRVRPASFYAVYRSGHVTMIVRPVLP